MVNGCCTIAACQSLCTGLVASCHSAATALLALLSLLQVLYIFIKSLRPEHQCVSVRERNCISSSYLGLMRCLNSPGTALCDISRQSVTTLVTPRKSAYLMTGPVCLLLPRKASQVRCRA